MVDAGVDGTFFRMRAAQEDGGGTRVIGAGVRANAAGERMGEITDHADAVAQFFERLQGFGEFEACAFLRRGPFVHRGAVRDVDAAEAALRRRPRFC